MIDRITQSLPVSPHVTTYDVCVATPETVVANYEREYEPPEKYSARVLTKDDLSLLEKARPCYASVAKERMSDGHTGIVALNENEVASIAWLYQNPTEVSTTVMYYDLGPKMSWFHSDWTAEKHRGEGLHTFLIYERAKYALETGVTDAIESNISIENEISKHNYTKLGFDNDRQFTMLYVHDSLNVKW